MSDLTADLVEAVRAAIGAAFSDLAAYIACGEPHVEERDLDAMAEAAVSAVVERLGPPF